MKFNLDREIRLLKEDEYSSLYTWYLQEFSSDGTAVSEKLIPWSWRLDFSATAIDYIRHFQVDQSDDDGDELSHSERISAIIKPSGNSRLSEKYPPTFSMFGTDRTISNFHLFVQCLKSDDDRECCRVWGSPSYNFELDFRNSIEDDQIDFTVYLKSTNFASLCQLVQSKSCDDSLMFSVKGVNGFYAGWSPAISTHKVKVLTSGDEQLVVKSKEHAEPPRLGEVSEFSLIFRRRNMLIVPDSDDNIKLSELDNELIEQQIPTRDKSQVELSDSITRLQTLVAAMKLPLWIIVALLIASLFLRW